MVDITIVRLVPTTSRAEHAVENDVPTYIVERVTWRIGDQIRRRHRPGLQKRCESCDQPLPRPSHRPDRTGRANG